MTEGTVETGLTVLVILTELTVFVELTVLSELTVLRQLTVVTTHDGCTSSDTEYKDGVKAKTIRSIINRSTYF